MSGEPALQTWWFWLFKVSLQFAPPCELILYIVRQGDSYSAALVSWTGSWKGLRSACLSGRKKYGESGEAEPASCSHELVKQLICLWNCSCDLERQLLCLENTTWGFSTAEWERVVGRMFCIAEEVSEEQKLVLYWGYAREVESTNFSTAVENWKQV